MIIQTRKKLDVKEGDGGFYVPDLTTYGVKSVKEMLKVCLFVSVL
jgi:hypothetical protein